MMLSLLETILVMYLMEKDNGTQEEEGKGENQTSRKQEVDACNL